jgi:GT2 family glycosyltransferase
MPSFHCSPNHELALTSGAMMHHAAFRTALARRAGVFAGALAKYRLGLALLCGSAPVRAAFVPHVLLHAVAPAAPLGEAGAALLQAHLDRAGADALVSVQPDSGLLSINWPLPSEPPLVSILIPTRDRLDLLALCVDSILALTTYKNFELIVIDNGSLEPATLAWLYERQQAGILEVVRVDGPFNWSRLNNRAVTMARGQVLCLLNNDTEVITPGWLDELVSQALRPDVGVVGPALLYPNGSVQNAGLYLDFAVPDRPQRLGRLCWGLDWSHSRLRVAQEVSAVSGACLVVRREVYAAAGGMDEQHLAAAMNDVDFNFRVRKSLRLRVVWTPHARLYHRALASRGRPNSPEQIAQTNYERAHFNACWHDAAMDEPAFSPDMRGCDAPVLAPPHRARAAATARRLNTARRRVLFVHVPKTAGEAMRHLLEAEYPGTLCAFSARTMLRCYDGDAVTLADTARRFAGADIGIGHVAHGFGALLGQDCIYATVMRDPVARTVSQFGHLLAGLASPVRGSWLSDAPIEVWLRCGVLRGNLMLHRILGERPEPVGWARFEHGSFPFPPQFCGFRLPEALWEGRADLLRAAPELPPETDEGLLVRAIEQLRESFCFVGRQEALDAHLRALGDVLGWGKASPPAVHNQARTKVAPLSASQIELVEAYNRLDRALLNYIDALPGGMILRPELIYAGRPVSESKE